MKSIWRKEQKQQASAKGIFKDDFADQTITIGELRIWLEQNNLNNELNNLDKTLNDIWHLVNPPEPPPQRQQPPPQQSQQSPVDYEPL